MAIFFYLFAGFIVASSLMVVTSKNPVYSVLWLIFAFCNTSGLMILLGAEFLGMMLIVIYVGAVAVLFLFVVMMLDINFAEMRRDLRKNLPFSILIAIILFIDLITIILLGVKAINVDGPKAFAIPKEIGNIYAIGEVLYTDFILPFQTAGIILFTAMIACIALTLRHREGVRRQDVGAQLHKNKDNSLSIVKVISNKGVTGINYDK